MLSELETGFALKLLLTALLAGLIGLNRESRDKPAGFRTHLLVGVGATLFTVLSLSLSSDPARVAANVVVGIGFLGAGSIFRSKDHVLGLTTAADLWVVAAIGMAVGLGFGGLAIFSTLLVLAVLLTGPRISAWLHRFHSHEENAPED